MGKLELLESRLCVMCAYAINTDNVYRWRDVRDTVRLLREKIDANPLYDHLKGQALRDAIKETINEVFGKCEK